MKKKQKKIVINESDFDFDKLFEFLLDFYFWKQAAKKNTELLKLILN